MTGEGVVTRQGAGRQSVSATKDWGTPPKYVEAVRSVFGGRIALDPCSNRHSIVGAEVEYLLPEHDGLVASWNYPTIFVNPPYGSDRERGTTIKDWLGRCVAATASFASQVIALVPVATNTSHWKAHVFTKAAGVCFLADTRLRFLEQGRDVGKGAPMSCAMVYWGTDFERFREVFCHHGAVLDFRKLIGREIGGWSG